MTSETDNREGAAIGKSRKSSGAYMLAFAAWAQAFALAWFMLFEVLTGFWPIAYFVLCLYIGWRAGALARWPPPTDGQLLEYYAKRDFDKGTSQAGKVERKRDERRGR